MTTDTLWCVNGEHQWERPRKAGPVPVNCPDHKPPKKKYRYPYKRRSGVPMTLHCENGDHDWTWLKKQGRLPLNCPDHRTEDGYRPAPPKKTIRCSSGHLWDWPEKGRQPPSCPEHQTERERLSLVVANWNLLTSKQRQDAEARGEKLREHTATDQEMAERAEVVKHLMLTAERATSRRGYAYRGLTLGLPKTESAFLMIERMTVTLREEDPDIAWEMVRDGRRQVIEHSRWGSLEEHLESVASWHLLDLWAECPQQGQVWIEKADLASMLADAANDVGLNVMPSGGFEGLSFLRKQIRAAGVDGRPLVVFEMRDYDSSANRAREAFRRRITGWADEEGTEISFVNVALTREQIDEHSIPTRPQKETTHTREEDDDDAAELDAVDALYPGLLQDWLREAVEPYIARYRNAVEENERIDLLVANAVVSRLPEIRRELIADDANDLEPPERGP